MELNLLAGRRSGDLTRHPLLPWVLDMTEPPEAGMDSSQVSTLTGFGTRHYLLVPSRHCQPSEGR